MVACFGLVYAGGVLAMRFGIVPWERASIREAILRCCGDALAAAAGPETRAAEAARRIRRWVIQTKRATTVGEDFLPENVDRYDVIYDRDRGEPVALVQRDRLVAVVGGEADLNAVLDLGKREGWLVPNQETGAVTRQKRFPGTWKKPRFIFLRRSFLDTAGAAEE